MSAPRMVAWLLSRWQREAEQVPVQVPVFLPDPAPEPEWPPYPPPADEAAVFTVAEEVRLRDLAGRLRDAGDGARSWGDRLADSLRQQVPDLPDAALARVALAVLAFAEEASAEQDHGTEDTLCVLADALLGAPAALAAVDLDLDLAGEGRRWR